ncbi:MAG TPA: hypothetical protein DEQ02_10110 [Ruminococcaceae bacterium]|nr:hypothetical protein [Oscillospiraceae bacterium]
MNNQPDISKIENVGLMILNNAPSELSFVARLFENLSDRQVNIDMISQAPPHGDVTALAFSFNESDLAKVLEEVAELRKVYDSVSPSVSTGNVKILVNSEQMRYEHGFASRVFRALAEISADIRLITTSEIDISILLPKANAADSLTAIKSAFNK